MTQREKRPGAPRSFKEGLLDVVLGIPTVGVATIARRKHRAREVLHQRLAEVAAYPVPDSRRPVSKLEQQLPVLTAERARQIDAEVGKVSRELQRRMAVYKRTGFVGDLWKDATGAYKVPSEDIVSALLSEWLRSQDAQKPTENK